MIKNINITYNSASQLHITWEWRDNQDPSIIPSCQIFCCGVPEDTLLEEGLFLENEILEYFNDKVLGNESLDMRQRIDSYTNRHSNVSRKREYQRQSNQREAVDFKLYDGAENHILLVYIYDDNEIFSRIIANGKGQEIPLLPSCR